MHIDREQETPEVKVHPDLEATVDIPMDKPLEGPAMDEWLAMIGAYPDCPTGTSVTAGTRTAGTKTMVRLHAPVDAIAEALGWFERAVQSVDPRWQERLEKVTEEQKLAERSVDMWWGSYGVVQTVAHGTTIR